MKNFNFNRAWESYLSSEISLIQKCVLNISVLTIHIHIIQKVSKFLSLEIKYNLKTVNYLDITLDLNTGNHKLHCKPNDEILYIHAKSNHTANILKQLPISVEIRLSNLSSNSEIFHEASKIS